MQPRQMSFLLATFLILIPTVAKADTWLCIADRSTGFYYNESSKKWLQTNFKTENNRYIIKRSQRDNLTWEVNEFGAAESFFPHAVCNSDFTEGGFLHCTGILSEFKFNKNNGRYVYTFTGSYITYNPQSSLEMFRKDGGDTPLIEIGTCSRI